MKTVWSLQPVRTLLSIIFASYHYHIQHLISASSISNHNSYMNGSFVELSNTFLSRTKRQYGGYCPPNCFQCNFNQCNQLFHQQQQPKCMPLIINCCCQPQKLDIKTACDGDEAVAGCMNGLCGQGYYCTRRQFCCRCPNGKSIGQAVNGMCPVGYASNANNFCCAIGAGSVLGKCINGLCPAGYACGDGDLCYAKSSGTVRSNSGSTSGNSRNSLLAIRPVVGSKNKPSLTRRTAQKKSTRRAKARKTKRVGEGITLLSVNNQAGHTTSLLNHPNGEQSWIDEQGNVILYDDYDGEIPFF